MMRVTKMIIRHMISSDDCKNVDIYLFRVVSVAIYLKMDFVCVKNEYVMRFLFW